MTQDREVKRLPTPDAPGWPDDEYSADLGHTDTPADVGDATDSTRPLGHHEGDAARARVGERASELPILVDGTRLRQGTTYVDLNRLDDGVFVGRAGQRAEPGQLIVSRARVGYDLWNQLTGEGPTGAAPRQERQER